MTTPTAASSSNIAPRIVYEDLREWLDEARKLGEVKDVSGLSWQQDIGMIAGVAPHDDNAPFRGAGCWSISSAASART